VEIADGHRGRVPRAGGNAEADGGANAESVEGLNDADLEDGPSRSSGEEIADGSRRAKQGESWCFGHSDTIIAPGACFRFVLLTEGIYRHYGFDFRDYSLLSLRRRVWKRVYAEALSSISGLTERVLHAAASMERLLLDLSLLTTAMFRDPTFYLAFRGKVVPMLRTYPFVRIWHAGCSTGEEVYSILQHCVMRKFELIVIGCSLGRSGTGDGRGSVDAGGGNRRGSDGSNLAFGTDRTVSGRTLPMTTQWI
jgi:hypothetical protein